MVLLLQCVREGNGWSKMGVDPVLLIKWGGVLGLCWSGLGEGVGLGLVIGLEMGCCNIKGPVW